LNYSAHPNKGNSYEYDLNGNLIKKIETIQGNAKLITSYTYDDENRLITVTMAKGNKTKEISFTYDPFGRRISQTIEKEEFTDEDDIKDNGNHNGNDKDNNHDQDKDGDKHQNKHDDYPRITYYVYDEQNIIAEYDQNGKQTASYIHGPNIDEPLSAEIRNTRIYYHADGLGTITSLTNHMGVAVQKYDYDSFGNINFTPFPHWIKQPYTYTGREFDFESGLYYYRARYYDSKVGRFVTKDPIGFGGGDVNLYGYVKNNPVNKIDPLGLYETLFGPRFEGDKSPGMNWYDAWPWNGNLFPGYTDQDWVCSPPAQALNKNKCTKKCCFNHDRCYERYGCNYSSWIGGFSFGLCKLCNLQAAICVAAQKVGGCSECE
jgi:RHS repeat-associated protein